MFKLGNVAKVTVKNLNVVFEGRLAHDVLNAIAKVKLGYEVSFLTVRGNKNEM